MNIIKNRSTASITSIGGETTFLSNEVETRILQPINLTGKSCGPYHYFDFDNWCNCCNYRCSKKCFNCFCPCFVILISCLF